MKGVKNSKKKIEQTKEEVLKYYPVTVHDQTNSYVTREAEPGERWDADDIAMDTTVIGVETKEAGSTKGYYDLAVPFEVVDGEDYYLVWAVYSDGDSFHHEEGCHRHIELFKTKEKAETLARKIQVHNDIYNEHNSYRSYHDKKPTPKPKDYDTYSLKYLNEAGVEMNCHCSWNGYFERLTAINIDRVRKHGGNRRSGLIQTRY